LSKNIINELGSLALATRLKNLSDRLAGDVAQFYKNSDVEFEPRWFTFIYALKDGAEFSVTQLAGMLNQTHPAVNQVANTLVNKGFVEEFRDSNDQRKRILKLSKKGNGLVVKMSPLWEKIKKANDDLLAESADLLNALDLVEQALDKHSMLDRLK